MKKILEILLCCLLAFSIPTYAAYAAVGQPVTDKGYQVTVNKVESAHSYDYYDAPSGSKLVSLDVTIASVADSKVDVNPFYATLKTTDGFVYNLTFFGKEPQLPAKNDLSKGDLTRGWVTFEVPDETEDFIFEYEPVTFFSKAPVLRISLKTP